jgi:hypothetical protein
MFDRSSFHALSDTEGALLVEAYADTGPANGEEVRKLLNSLGPLFDFRPATPSTASIVRSKSCTQDGYHTSQVFFADYYDARNASTARQTLDGRLIFHTRLRIFWASEVNGELEEAAEKDQLVQDTMPYPLMSYGSLHGDNEHINLSSPTIPTIPLPLPESPTPKKSNENADCKC